MDYLKAGEKKLKEWSLFNSNKYAEALELFQKAANKFKLDKNTEKAIEAYNRAIEIQIKMDDSYGAVTNYVAIYNLCHNDDPLKSIQYLKKAVEINLNDGRFTTAANQLVNIAEAYEEDDQFDKALEYYQKAADIYETEHNTNKSNQCLLKIADYAVRRNNNCAKAIHIYETVAKSSLKNNLLKWSANDYFLRAGLLYLCENDLVKCKEQINNYMQWCHSFALSSECRFLLNIVDSYENFDADHFTEVVMEYDKLKPLDYWKVHVLNQIKNYLKGTNNNDSGLA